MRMGMQELLLVFGILILLFGAKKLPALADGMGKAIRNFKKGMNEDDDKDVTPQQMSSSSSASDVPSQSASRPVEHKG